MGFHFSAFRLSPTAASADEENTISYFKFVSSFSQAVKWMAAHKVPETLKAIIHVATTTDYSL
jgi:hypothetical protein